MALKIYGIYKGCKFEGGSVLSPLYYKQEVAQHYAKELALSENRSSKKYERLIYKQKNENTWETNMDIITVLEYEII